MTSKTLGRVVTVVGLLAFIAGFMRLLPCLFSLWDESFAHCWSDFLLTAVGALLFTR
ncbi:hypothetical protein [Haloferax sp. DFSO60]|uniref:hypothetical protein n=1 Tax=Haloferax sp. DFSO60 TaxID=3388652 RepID=UPI00397BDE86